MYSTIVMLILLWHDGLFASSSTNEALGVVAKSALSKFLALSPCVFKWCDTHVYHAIKDHPQRMNNPPPEARLYKEQFLHIPNHVAKVAKNETQTCKAFALLSVLVAIHHVKNITVKSFGVRSKAPEHHDCRSAKEHAKTLNVVVKEKFGKMKIIDLSIINEVLSMEMSKVGRSEARHEFNGSTFAMSITERILNECLPLVIPYLSRVDQKIRKM